MSVRANCIDLLLLVGLTVAITVLSGCGRSEPESPSPSSAAAPATPPPPPPPLVAPKAPAQPPAPAKALPAPTKKPPAPAKAPAKTAQKTPTTVQKAAAVGAGAKGRGYGEGMVATPVATYFIVKERIAYDIQIPHAMNLFKATEGHAPKTHEEFMEKIVKANQIHLPTLPSGHRYVYDPEQGQLMVAQPAR
jgi:type IV secretory pathway VirB10-like protein